MALIIPNIGNSAICDANTGAIKAPITKMDSIKLDVDGKLTPVYGGSGMFSIVNISADRAPKVTLQGPELPLAAASTLLGATTTVAASGSPIQQDAIDVKTIPSGGVVPLDNTVSATVTTASVVSVKTGKAYTGVASAPTTGQYINPAASATSITFNTSDAGDVVMIKYTTDTTTGGKVDFGTSTIQGAYKFVAQGKVVNTEDPSKALVPITFVVYSAQFIGQWSASMERQKASANSIELSVLDPGGSNPAVTIITQAKFAG